MYHGEVVPGFPRSSASRLRDRHDRAARASSITPTRSARRRASARATRSGSPRAAASCHSEMFPLLEREKPNPLELFQIWLNLPAADKMVDPHFAMLWSKRRAAGDVRGRRRSASPTVTIVAGELDGKRAPPPPPQVVGRASRHRRRDLDDPHAGGRDVDARRRRRTTMQYVRSISSTARRSRSAASVGREHAALVVESDADARARGRRRRRRRSSCSKAVRSASRSSRTVRS